MPGFNGKGPRGEGPMTGGGRGYCVSDISDNRPAGVGRGGFPRGGGRGRAWGGGRGRGAGRGFGRGYFAQGSNSQDERTYLSDHLSVLENEMREIKERLKELDNKKEKE